MSEALHLFGGPGGPCAVALPVPYPDLIADWAALRRRMLRQVAPGFSRDEWAYLAGFLEPEQLESHFHDNFGAPVDAPDASPRRLYRPRGAIAVWLPNNVSLLGPLTLVLLSLTGQPLRLKLGSSADDLAGAFLRFALDHLDDGVLKRYLASSVSAKRFDRDDPRHAEMAATSKVRIVFGSDAAATAIHALPHPLDSVGFSFTDRRSEAWLDVKHASDDGILSDLVKVFSIYGQAGCTSPRRVVLLDGSDHDVEQLVERLLAAWPTVIRQRMSMHVASDNLKADQWARALGWRTRLAPDNAAVLAFGPPGLEPVNGQMTLMLQAATPDQAFAGLPANIQTVGHALARPDDPDLLWRLGRSKVMRFVPLARMHHFGSTWDGQSFWRECFEVTEIGG